MSALQDALRRVVAGESLARAEMRAVVLEIMSGASPELLVGALLAALSVRGERVEELVGAAEALRSLALPLPPAGEDAIDTCGTGGGSASTFNVSTLVALVLAGAGVPVAKHGNRRATSRCGSAELLEALGVRVDAPPVQMAKCVSELGIGFLYARACHPAFAAVGALRQALGIPTLFNRLGPLVHPMAVRRQLVGVGRPEQLESTREVLVALGARSVWVVHGEDGMDEVSTSAPTRVAAFGERGAHAFRIEPGRHVPLASLEAVRGGDVTENAAIARAVLAGEPGPARDLVLINAAAAFCVAGEAADLDEGVARAARSLDSGAARERLARWAAHTRAAAQAGAA